MARISVRYLVQMPGREGLTRYFWQPSGKLRAAGWRPERVPANWAAFTDPAALEAAAIARAQELNAALDAGRLAAGAALAQPPPVVTRTLGDLIAHYRASREWSELRPSTQRGYRQCLERLFGALPVRQVDAAKVQQLRAAMAATPAFANAVLRVLRLLLEHGRRHGWLTINPALRPGLTNSEPRGLIWPHAAVEAFVAAADAMGRHSIGTAVLLNEWLGQREGDVLRMPRRLRVGSLIMLQNKTRARVTLPVGMVPRLAERIEQELARLGERERDRPPATTLIVDESTGRPYTADAFRHRFAEIRAQAAQAAPSFEIDYLLPGRDMADPEAFVVHMRELTFMVLRHTAVTRLAEAQCTSLLIASVTGHSVATVDQILRRYMVHTGEMVRVAFQKRLDAERG